MNTITVVCSPRSKLHILADGDRTFCHRLPPTGRWYSKLKMPLDMLEGSEVCLTCYPCWAKEKEE